MKVRATEPCFFDLTLRPAGAEFEYDGPPQAFLVPVEKQEETPAPAPVRRGRPPKQDNADAPAE